MAALRDLETEKLSPWNRDHRQQGSPPHPSARGHEGSLGTRRQSLKPNWPPLRPPSGADEMSGVRST